MVRKKRVQRLDGRQRSMIENALHCANPPEATQRVVVEYPPILEYIWKLVYKDLNRTNTEKVHTHTLMQSSSCNLVLDHGHLPITTPTDTQTDA